MRLAAVEQHDGLEHLSYAGAAHRVVLGDTANGGEDGQPAGPGGVVPAQPVHHRDRGRGHAAPDRDGAARVLPAAAPLMAEGKSPVPLACQRGGRDQVLAAEVAFLTQERQAVVLFGVIQAAGDLPGRDTGEYRGVQRVFQLEGHPRVASQRGQHADALGGGGSGAVDIALGHQAGRHGVVGGADQERVAGLAGQAERPAGPSGGLRPGQAGILGPGGADRGGRTRVAAGPGPRVGQQPGRGARGGQSGVHAGEPVDVLGAAGEGDRGGRRITGSQVRGGGRPVQPQCLVARGPDLGGRGRAFQRPGGGRRVAGQHRGLLVALLRLAEPAAGEQQPGERRRQPPGVGLLGGERGRPCQGRAELVGGGVEGRLPLRPGRVGAVEPGRLGQAPAQVPTVGAAAVAVGLGVEPGRGELANRFQGVVARPPGTGHGRQQAVLGEPAQRVRHPGRLHRVIPGHRRRRGEAERSGEHRHPAQHRLLARIQQPVAPVQRVVQGAVPLLLPGASGQQAQLITQARLETVQAQ